MSFSFLTRDKAFVEQQVKQDDIVMINIVYNLNLALSKLARSVQF